MLRLVFASFEFLDHLSPIVGDGDGDVVFVVEAYHDGLADAFHIVVFHVDDALNEGEALVADVADGGLHLYIAVEEDGFEEIDFGMGNYDVNTLRCDNLPFQGREIGCFAEVVE